MLGRRGDGRFYDRFRDRLMFPIHDLAGRVVAFSGRILPGTPVTGDTPPPKYLNSPESPIFKKGQTIFGLGLARDAIRTRERVIVVEGNLDVIAVSQAGIGEVVAPLGTALTADQLRVLRRFTETVIVCFDGDEAGRRAAAESFPTFVEAGLWGRGVFLPAGDDPDTFVRATCAALSEKIEALLDAGRAADRRLHGRARRAARCDAVGRRAEAAKEVARILERVRTATSAMQLLRLAAYRLGVREPEVLGAGVPAQPATPPRRAPDDRSPRGRGAADRAHGGRSDDRAAAPARRSVLADFEQPEWRALAQTHRRRAAIDAPAAVLERLPRALRDRVVRRVDRRERRGRPRARARRLHREDPGSPSGRSRSACSTSCAPPRRVATTPPRRHAQEELKQVLLGEESHMRSLAVSIDRRQRACRPCRPMRSSCPPRAFRTRPTQASELLEPLDDLERRRAPTR